MAGKHWPDDCTGLLKAVYAQEGIDLLQLGQPGDNGVSAIWRYAESRGRTYRGGHPVPGDLVFFTETYDKNRDGARNDGLTVVFNNNYVHNNLAVQFSVVPEYMTVNPTSGTVPAGGSAALNVNFNTQDMFGGTYNGSIRISSNDPDEGIKVVPTQLVAVGTPNLATQPASLDFGTRQRTKRQLAAELATDR